MPPRRPARARRGATLAVAGALAVAAFTAGLVSGAGHDDDVRRIGAEYVAAWSRGEYAAMHALLTPEARRAVPLRRFARLHERTAATATLVRVLPRGAAVVRDDVVRVPVGLRTRAFGPLRATAALPVARGDGDPGVAWAPHLALPGVRRGEALRRSTRLAPRADILAADGTVLAGGPARLPAAGVSAPGLVGSVGPVPAERRAALDAVGVPPTARVGVSGLERWLDDELRGRPGGVLRAGNRVLARSAPLVAAPVRTPIDLDVQSAADVALAGRLGGIVALRPGTGEVLAAAGLATSAPQPPGSTFKIVTLAAALDARTVRPRERFPARTAATLEGVELQNANGEICGGTLREAFAHSCNSVFAPLGAEVGDARLVRMAERFAFNAPPPLAGAAPSTLPAAGEIGDDLAVGSTAIGQGRVLATPLQMAWVAATIANEGRRVTPTVRSGRRGSARRVLSARVARFVDRAMRAVVRFGTGQAAAIPGVTVAGKTGTAELRTTQGPDAGDPLTPGADAAPDLTDTTAWFAAYAPASRPRVAVAVMLVGHGAGGDTAAPAARPVIEAALAAARSDD